MTATRCAWCELTIEQERPRGESAFCSGRCKLAYHNQKSRETGWLLLVMVRQLWPLRPEGWTFVAEEFPGVPRWREEWNRFGAWARDQAEVRDGSD